MAEVDLSQALQATFEHEIPITRQIGLEVAAYDGASLTLRAPLVPNVNHKSTAFAGSLNAVATLAGWGLVWLLLRERGLRGTIEFAARGPLPEGRGRQGEEAPLPPSVLRYH